jgi:agmatinase
LRPNEPGYAGVSITFCRMPLVLDPAQLAGVDVAVLGAPFDDGVSFRPGTRFVCVCRIQARRGPN